MSKINNSYSLKLAVDDVRNMVLSNFWCLSHFIEYQRFGLDANVDEKLCGSNILRLQGTDEFAVNF